MGLLLILIGLLVAIFLSYIIGLILIVIGVVVLVMGFSGGRGWY